MLRAIKTFIKDPAPVTSIDQVEPGLNIVEGVVREKEAIRSPVKGHRCVAFFYRSFLVMTGGRAPAIHKLKQAEVYTDFALEMVGGTLEVVPARPGRFEQRDHQTLQRQYGAGFQGIEEVVMPGARVRVRGKVRVSGDKPVMTLSEVTLLDNQAAPTTGAVDRRKRKRKKSS